MQARAMRRTILTTAAVTAALTAFTGCGAFAAWMETPRGATPSPAPPPVVPQVRSTYQVAFEFDDAVRLRPGAAVKVAGATVGRVGPIIPNTKRFGALALIDVNRQYRIPADSTAKIVTPAPPGGPYIELAPGSDAHMLQAGDTLAVTRSTGQTAERSAQGAQAPAGQPDGGAGNNGQGRQGQ